MPHQLKNPHSFRDSQFESHDSFDPHRSPILAFYQGKLVIRTNGSFYHKFIELDKFASGETLFVGKVDGQSYYAIELLELHEDLAEVHLRDFLEADYETFSKASRARQLIDWDRCHRFCGACGAETLRGETEWVRHCPQCGHRAYPRTSPTVIMAVRKGDQILLAQRPNGLTDLYTVLAGFVEPGESAEHAVRREVYEETQLEIDNLRYFDSQPWPFPGQILFGFLADYASGELVPDENELKNAGWFHYLDLPDHPRMNTIAGRLIAQTVAEIQAGTRGDH